MSESIQKKQENNALADGDAKGKNQEVATTGSSTGSPGLKGLMQTSRTVYLIQMNQNISRSISTTLRGLQFMSVRNSPTEETSGTRLKSWRSTQSNSLSHWRLSQVSLNEKYGKDK